MNTACEILSYFIAKRKKMGYSTPPYWEYSRKIPQHLMEAWYQEARLYDLACTFEDFAWLIENETTSLYHKYYSYRSRWDRRQPLNENDRGQPHSTVGWGEKKVLSEEEIRKREWKKKFRKDKAKTHWRRGAGKYYKRLSNKMHRSFEREMIHHERYDKLYEVDYKFFLDPWLWD